MAQWLGLCASTAGGTGSIPDQGTKIMHVSGLGQKKKKDNQQGLRELYSIIYMGKESEKEWIYVYV